MIEIEVTRSHNIFTIIKTYFSNYLVDNSRFSLISTRDMTKRDKEDDLYINHIVLGNGVSNIKYPINGLDIEFQILCNEVGDPVGLDMESSRHEVMIIKIDDEKYSNYKELIDIMINNARRYYHTTIKNTGSSKEKVTCYIWDEYWDDLYSRKKRSLKTVHLNEKSDEVLEDMNKFLSIETEKKYELLGLPYKRNYLFEGYPGTGKTSLIYSLASELNMDVAIIQFNKDMDDIKFTKAMMRVPRSTLLVFEDIDVLFDENRKKNDVNKNMITLSGLLNILDGLMHQDKQIIIMTTNYKCTLDNALQRPGRIDYTLHFDFASKHQIQAMYSKFIPEQNERFEEFYSEISNIDITTATLQQFLFQNMTFDNILDRVYELKKLVNSIDYNGKNLKMLYM